MRQYPFPAAVTPFAGEILDLDCHESSPANLWVEIFGSAVKPFADACLRSGMVATNVVRERDETPLAADTVWTQKLEQAPGAFDMGRRLEMMDYVGIKTQVLYPGNYALLAQTLYSQAGSATSFPDEDFGDRKLFARDLMVAYNDWCARMARESDRLRAVGILLGETPEELHLEAKALIDQGLRAVMLAVDIPPGGVSPAHPALDPLWALLSDAGVPLLSHIILSREFLKTMTWLDAPAFKGYRTTSEFALDPWTMTSSFMPIQNFYNTMVLGGVFDRHPELKVSCAEFTGNWVGAWAANMDLWYENQPFMRGELHKPLKMKPSDYVRRNIRVACFPFEDVGNYIRQYGLDEVYCFASDFPHREGGKDPYGDYMRGLEAASPDTLRKFFVENAKLIVD